MWLIFYWYFHLDLLLFYIHIILLLLSWRCEHFFIVTFDSKRHFISIAHFFTYFTTKNIYPICIYTTKKERNSKIHLEFFNILNFHAKKNHQIKKNTPNERLMNSVMCCYFFFNSSYFFINVFSIVINVLAIVTGSFSDIFLYCTTVYHLISVNNFP